ncbi:MAG TPA: tetratricopeptide repeat protein [Stellaceae bacterium]|nr:tetratricopeptide repeat protein [Stellaceae bacterium]
MNRKERRAARSATGEAGAAARTSAALEHFARGIDQHRAGLLPEAEAAYRRAAALDPNRAEIHCNLGLVLQGQGRLPEAAAAFRRAVALAPDLREAQFNLGIALCELGEAAAAVPVLQRATTLLPDYAEAHYNLGNALRGSGRRAEAIASYCRAIALKPDFSDAYSNLGSLYADDGNLAEAERAFRRAGALSPAAAEPANNLGLVLHRLARYDEAAAAYRRALALKPGFAEAWNNLGVALHLAGNLPEAVEAYRKAIALKADFAGAYNNFGLLLREIGQHEEALAWHRRSLALQPQDADAHNNLGLVLQAMGRSAEAAEAYRQALARRPDFHEARVHLAFLRRSICDWQGLEQDIEQCRTIVLAHGQPHDPLAFINFTPDPAAQLRCARLWAASRTKGAGTLAPSRRANRDRLRIGYLSADLRQHPVAAQIAEVIERHDRARFEVIAYALCADDGSDLRKRLERGFDRFADLSLLPHAAAAERIRDDGIDILVDLMGYTGAARPAILAWRPAPVQASFLGFPGTMGAPFIDYIVADPVTAPAEHQRHFDERIVHLPECSMPNDSQRPIAAETPSRAACGLPERGFVFCCFNNPYKLTPAFFDIWMGLLRAVPESVLWLSVGAALAQDNLRREAAARGVAPERIVFAARVPGLADHLARHRCADLFLDTLPYNAHSTACDALWAGLPVVTCLGESLAGRVAASLLGAIGLSDLVTHSPEAYAALALALATDPVRLEDARRRLGANRRVAPLFDTARFTRHLEAAYARMWEIHAAGGPPQSFAVRPA